MWTPKSVRVVPLGKGSAKIDVYSLAPHGPGIRPSVLSYFQFARVGVLKAISRTGRDEDSPLGIEYANRVHEFTRSLADLVTTGMGGQEPDIVVELPSTRNYNKPYTAALSKRFPVRGILATRSVRRVMSNLVAALPSPKFSTTR